MSEIFDSIVHVSEKQTHGSVGYIPDILTGKTNANFHVINLRILCELASEIYRYSASSKGILLTFYYDSELPEYIYINPCGLMLVVNSLLCNAVRLTNQGGIFFHVTMQENSWVFRVADSGVGMGQKNIEHIHDRVHLSEIDHLRVAPEQYDEIGMTLAKEFTELLGGSLHIFSTTDVGTIAEVWIPIHKIDGNINQILQKEDINHKKYQIQQTSS